MSITSIYVDFDGTVSLQDSTDVLLSRFADPRWLDVEAAWVRGEIGSRQCLAEQVALLRVSRADLLDFAGQVRLDPAFPAFLSLCRALRLPVTILSDGLDLVVERALLSSGITMPVIANRLEDRGEGCWSLAFPYAEPACAAEAGNCKCAAVAPRARSRASGALLIGDGRSDFCAAGSAALVIAKGALREHCRNEGIAHHAFQSFDQINARLAGWLRAPRGEASIRPVAAAAAAWPARP